MVSSTIPYTYYIHLCHCSEINAAISKPLSDNQISWITGVHPTTLVTDSFNVNCPWSFNDHGIAELFLLWQKVGETMNSFQMEQKKREMCNMTIYLST